MELAGIWRQFFANWPNGLVTAGVVVTSFDQIPFASFAMSEHVVLLTRRAPDAVGSRRIVVPHSQIEAVKITESVDDSVFTGAGFIAPGPLK